jgi:hypothetical protein
LYEEQKRTAYKYDRFPKYNVKKMNILEELLKLQHPLKNNEQTNGAAKRQQDSTQLTTSDPVETRKEKRKAGQIKKNKLKQLKRHHEKLTEAANRAKNTAYLLMK